MANLWQFFGLPDPEGNNPPSRRQAPAPTPDSEPVSLNAKPVEETTDSTELADPPAVEATATTPSGHPPWMVWPAYARWRTVSRPWRGG